ncbi:MAG: hypothetical protein LBU32_10715 [Clostridiales bacterium]|nr:hypothetical protein [Clostridiales bacterium]
MDIMDAARQAEEGAARKAEEDAARKAEEDAADFACRDIMHWHYEHRKLKAARKLLKEKGLSPARRCWLNAGFPHMRRRPRDSSACFRFKRAGFARLLPNT